MTTLYVASIGHEYCDPVATVIGCSAAIVQQEIERIERDELTDYRNSYCDADCDEDDCQHMDGFSMWWTPPMPESALSVMRGAKELRGHLYSTDWDDVRHGALVV